MAFVNLDRHPKRRRVAPKIAALAAMGCAACRKNLLLTIAPWTAPRFAAMESASQMRTTTREKPAIVLRTVAGVEMAVAAIRTCSTPS